MRLSVPHGTAEDPQNNLPGPNRGLRNILDPHVSRPVKNCCFHLTHDLSPASFGWYPNAQLTTLGAEVALPTARSYSGGVKQVRGQDGSATVRTLTLTENQCQQAPSIHVSPCRFNAHAWRSAGSVKVESVRVLKAPKGPALSSPSADGFQPAENWAGRMTPTRQLTG